MTGLTESGERGGGGGGSGRGGGRDGRRGRGSQSLAQNLVADWLVEIDHGVGTRLIHLESEMTMFRVEKSWLASRNGWKLFELGSMTVGELSEQCERMNDYHIPSYSIRVRQHMNFPQKVPLFPTFLSIHRCSGLRA